MDYSKWKKILIILMIINLLWIFYNRVFATTTLNFEECLNKETNTFNLNGYTLKVPAFVLDYNYIIVSHIGEQWNIFFSNEQLILGEKSTNGNNRYGALTTSKYYYDHIATNVYYYRVFGRNSNISGFNLSNFNTFNTVWYDYDAFFDPNKDIYLISNFNLYSVDGTLLNQGEAYRKPTFDNPDSEIQSLDFDNLFVNPQDYGIEQKLYLKILEVTNVVNDSQDVTNNIYYYNDLTFALDNKSKYLKQFFDTDQYYYSIPYSALKLKKDKSYYIILTSNGSQLNQSQGEILENDFIFDTILVDTQNLITTQDEILNSIINNNPSQNTDDNINNNLPRPSYNDSDNNINIPGMNVEIPEDITENGFNNIFTTIYNTLYSATQPHPR